MAPTQLFSLPTSHCSRLLGDPLHDKDHATSQISYSLNDTLRLRMLQYTMSERSLNTKRSVNTINPKELPMHSSPVRLDIVMNQRNPTLIGPVCSVAMIRGSHSSTQHGSRYFNKALKIRVKVLPSIDHPQNGFPGRSWNFYSTVECFHGEPALIFKIRT